MFDEIKGLKNYISKLKQECEQDSLSFDKEKERILCEIKNKDITICEL